MKTNTIDCSKIDGDVVSDLTEEEFKKLLMEDGCLEEEIELINEFLSEQSEIMESISNLFKRIHQTQTLPEPVRVKTIFSLNRMILDYTKSIDEQL